VATAVWTDTHCHLEDERYLGDGDRDLGGVPGVLDRARAAGVSCFVTVGCDAESSRVAIACAEAHHDVWATVGLHPHEASHGVDTISGLVGSSNRVVAVGEAGLDHHYDHSPRDAQRTAFAAQIALAHRHRLPLVIHTREAWDETFDVLGAEGVPERTIFHCFTGGPAEARRALDVGAFISFSGIVTFKNALDVAEAARLCPDDRLLVETDSPYLAPVPHRGRVNQPSHVVDVGRRLATLRGCDESELARLTSDNARIAFPRLAS
jgi:TatD DNase family protein